ncbi:hypothetical protein NLJ89_g3101 [Agrocybe chaxingu]|uniref:Uncharacterized protein n=1 Tax=Agrocybe chaxingu TaxID=84603 RepID=A0A9W8K5Z0_9AGAR|nr:hypothetical protein NLJ89_g3101 [Agrocybe chaxingu]
MTSIMTSQETEIDPGSVERAEKRKRRLLEIEAEQEREEAEALKMTEEQRRTLLHSFKAVKVEFDDLDGQRWPQGLLRHPQASRGIVPKSSSSNNPMKRGTFTVLTNSFNPEDTIRVSASKPKSRRSLAHIPTVTPASNMDVDTLKSLPIFDNPICRHRDGTHARSPTRKRGGNVGVVQGSDNGERGRNPADVDSVSVLCASPSADGQIHEARSSKKAPSQPDVALRAGNRSSSMASSDPFITPSNDLSQSTIRAKCRRRVSVPSLLPSREAPAPPTSHSVLDRGPLASSSRNELPAKGPTSSSAPGTSNNGSSQKLTFSRLHAFFSQNRSQSSKSYTDEWVARLHRNI